MSQSTLHLKLATEDDLEVFLPLVKELFDHSVYSEVGTFDEEYVRKMFLNSFQLGQDKVCSVLLYSNEEPVGIISMSKTVMLANAEDEMALELAFWIKPEFRSLTSLRKLIQAYHYWAKLTQCKAVFLGKIKNRKAPEEYIVRRIK